MWAEILLIRPQLLCYILNRNDKSEHITHLDNVVRIIIVWSECNYRIPRNYEQQKWYSGSRQSVFPPILNREHLRRPIGQGAAFFFSQLRDKLSQSSAIGRRWELSLVLLALDFFFKFFDFFISLCPFIVVNCTNQYTHFFQGQ